MEDIHEDVIKYLIKEHKEIKSQLLKISKAGNGTNNNAILIDILARVV
jgi:hypothetical protein